MTAKHPTDVIAPATFNAGYERRQRLFNVVRGPARLIASLSTVTALVFGGLLIFRSSAWFPIIEGYDGQAMASLGLQQAGTGVWASASDGSYKLLQTRTAITTVAQASAATANTTAAATTSPTAGIGYVLNPTAITTKEWRLEFTAKAQAIDAQSPANITVVFNVMNANNYAYANFAASNGPGLNGIYRVQDGSVSQLEHFSKSIKAGVAYEIMARESNGAVRVFIDGAFYGKTDVPMIRPMQVGFGSIASNVAINDLKLSVKGKLAATTPPSSATPPASPATPSPSPTTSTPPAPAQPATPSSSGRLVKVSTSAQLTAALAGAQPGDTISLADGTYSAKVSLNGKSASFALGRSGTATQPIILNGSAKAIIDGGGIGGSYGLYLASVRYWQVTGLTVTNAAKGIVLDGSSNNLISGVTVSNIGDEAVHFRSFSSDNTITNSIISDTGKKQPAYGEGVYIGSATSNWKTYSNGKPDTSDRNKVIGNIIKMTGAESIDIKEGSSNGLIQNNQFNGAGMSGENYADSWLDVKGNGYSIIGNAGTTSIGDGFQVHVAVSGWGEGNSFRANSLKVNGPGIGFNLQSSAKNNLIYCDNVVSGAKNGFGNVTCINQ